LSEETANTSRMPTFRSAIQYWTLYQRPIGITAQATKAANTAIVGATTYRTRSVLAGTKLSLNTSLTPSAAICIRP
jgi:hypothetical protein